MEKILELQAQSSLAKLLAKENITVTHSKGLKTAHFDVKNRVLGLPIWKDQGKVVYDMLVGHEVSHALYTPLEGFEKFIEEVGRNNFDILNIIEDIRIERLIKKTYAGMPRIFNGAYKTLIEKDFFQIADKDLSSLKFIDRLNLQGKVGNLVDIPLNDDERALYEECYAAETFEEVVDLYHKIKKFSDENETPEDLKSQSSAEGENSQNNDGEELTEESQSSEDEGDGFDNSSTIPEVGDVDDDGTESHSISSNVSDEDMEKALDEFLEQRKNQPQETSDDDGEEKLGQDAAGGPSDSGGKDIEIEHKSETLNNFEENLLEEEETDHYGRHRSGIALWPRANNIDDRVVSYKEVMADRKSYAEEIRANNWYGDENETYINQMSERTIVLRNTINKKVGVLVREFERRKAAYQYSRAQESRKGSLDVNKLHRYKYDDQIFESVMNLADAKSHGMMFFIDYSGSMSSVLKDVLEHTLNLVHFCQKVGIPYQVFSFTSNYAFGDDDKKLTQSEYEFPVTDLVLAELFSSEMSKTEYKKAFTQISEQILNSSEYRFSQTGISKFEHLGGTPLDASLISSVHLIEKFKKKNPVQKMNVIVLTDGESHGCRPDSLGYSCEKITTSVKGKQHTIPTYHSTQALTKIVHKMTGANMIGWFLPESKRDGNSHLNKMAYNRSKESAYAKAGEWMKKYRKDGFFALNDCFGYNSYFLLKSDIKIEDEEFEFDGTSNISDDKAAQTKLARQFAKHNVANRTNRIIMTKFAEIIA